MRPRPSLPEVSVGCGGGVAGELQRPALQRPLSGLRGHAVAVEAAEAGPHGDHKISFYP